MVPMIVIGGCLGRLFGLVIRSIPFLGSFSEPSFFALIGSTSVLAGSGQIRLFLTVVMLEITDQLHLAPFVALAAIVSVLSAKLLSPHGLYHALIEQAGLPYLPLERSSHSHSKSHRHTHAHGQGRHVVGGGYHSEALVSDMMASPLITVQPTQSKAELVHTVLALAEHNGFPAVSDGGKLDGLLLRDELAYFPDSALVEVMMDRAPATVRPEWPISRAHRLFAALGLRHLLVVSKEGQVVGILTRHDLHEDPPHRPLLVAHDDHDAPTTRTETAPGSAASTPTSAAAAAAASANSREVGGGGGGGDISAPGTTLPLCAADALSSMPSRQTSGSSTVGPPPGAVVR
jgi:chloride channel 7